MSGAQLVFELDLSSLGVRTTWTPTEAERLLCAAVVRGFPVLEPTDGDQRRRWHALRETPSAAIAVLREASPDQLGFASQGPLQEHAHDRRLISILMDAIAHLGDHDARLRFAGHNEFRRSCEWFERDVVELRRAVTEAAADDGGPATKVDRPRVAPTSVLLRSAINLLEVTGTAGVEAVYVRPYSTHAPIVLELAAEMSADDEPLRTLMSQTRAVAYTPENQTGSHQVAAVCSTTGQGFAVHAYYYSQALALPKPRRRWFPRRPKNKVKWLVRLGLLADFSEKHLDKCSTLDVETRGSYLSIGVLQFDVPIVMSALGDDPESRDENGYRWGLLPGAAKYKMFVGGGNGKYGRHTPVDPCKSKCNQVAVGRIPRRDFNCSVVR
ncbi:hypothetical protein [Amycolatopsis antarctica]|uniref:hypothetical protein n=1 Tax=Amycolatopsis antarctica TaxID=1854586 RepID=UPI0010548A2A|nr:hypothetical protein [Amycolatopsis antarctica]